MMHGLRLMMEVQRGSYRVERNVVCARLQYARYLSACSRLWLKLIVHIEEPFPRLLISQEPNLCNFLPFTMFLNWALAYQQ